MKTDNQHTHTFSYWKDLLAFLATVTVCSFLLVFSLSFTKPTEIIVGATPVLAMPRPPAPLALAPEPEPVLPEIETAWVLPEIEVAWVLPEIEVAWVLPEIEVAWVLPKIEATSPGIETISMISSTPDGALPHEQIPFHGIIVQVAGRYEVDPHLVRAIIFAESGYNPRAKSKKGARGLMQLMPSTAESLGVQDIYDPEENIDGGVRYFRSLLDRFEGDVQLALAAYNAGSRHVRNYEGVPPFRATRLYIKKVLKFHKKFKAEMAARTARLA